MQGLPQDSAEHIAHIHSDATCADDRAGQGGSVEHPLESVTAQPDGTGSSITVIPDVTLAQLFDRTKRYVNIHAEKSGSGTPQGIARADLALAGMQGEQTMMMESTQTLPTSGAPVIGSPSVLLPAAALIAGSGIQVFAVLRRR